MPSIEPQGVPPAGDDPGYELVDGPDPRVHTFAVRAALLLLAAGFAALFGIAVYLNPYAADGTPKTMATHTQLGLPPCNMVAMIGKPCPACGMSTSFSLLVRGDVPAAARANWVGMLIAIYGMLLIPWALASAYRGKLIGVRSGELLMLGSLTVLVVLMTARWVAVLLSN